MLKLWISQRKWRERETKDHVDYEWRGFITDFKSCGASQDFILTMLCHEILSDSAS